MSKICVSIGEETYADTLKVLQAVDFAEIRLDMSDMVDDEIRSVFSQPKVLVATCRKGRYDDTQRLHRLKVAIQAGAKYVDIETEANPVFQHEARVCALEHNCKVIISYHNFISTPAPLFLEEMVQVCLSQGADLVKLVTTAHYPVECSRLLSLYRYHKNLVAFAMGDVGKITRVASLYLGAPFTYASVSTKKSVAAGQLSHHVISEIMRLMEE